MSMERVWSDSGVSLEWALSEYEVSVGEVCDEYFVYLELAWSVSGMDVK